MNQKKETTVSDVFARRSVWVKVRRGLAVPFVALAMVSGLLLMLRQPVTTAAAATQPSPAGDITTTGVTAERVPTANILYVTATANGTLCTIADPCALQDAVDAAANGDEIHVAAGVYDDVVGNGTFTQTVQVNKNITLRGGYDSANWLAEPDPVANETILDGLNQGRAIYIFAASPTIEGFTIRNGYASTGAGIFKVTIQGSIIRNNRFYNNTVTGSGLQSGGAISTRGADTIIDNVIYDNDADSNGGGIFVDNQSSSPTLIQYNRIYNNAAGTVGATIGGGIYIFNGPVTIDGNEIYNNTAFHGGGIGVSNQANINALIQNNLIYNDQALLNDSANGAGGGVLLGGPARLIHNTIVDNSASFAFVPQFFDMNAYARLRFDHAARNRHLQKLPFAWLLLNGAYHPQILPPYLTEAGHDTIRDRIRRLKLRTASLQETVAAAESGTFDGVSLSDYSSYCDPAEQKKVWHHLAHRMAPGARVCERKFFNKSGIEIPSEAGFRRIEDLEERLSASDGAWFYTFVVAVKEDAHVA